MINLSHTENQITCVTNFQDLITTPFHEEINALCWTRKLQGDFAEIVNKIAINDDEDIVELYEEELRELKLSEQGQLARKIILNDLKTLTAYGASPVLNLIRCYEKDDNYTFFPTDVYSFHVDRSPVPTDTFLCTYYGESSEILSNAQAEQNVLVPEIRDQIKKLYQGADEDFESFLSEQFLDLHYRAKATACPVSLGLGNLWKLAVDHPGSQVLPCVHRAPKEKSGKHRLLLIC